MTEPHRPSADQRREPVLHRTDPPRWRLPRTGHPPAPLDPAPPPERPLAQTPHRLRLRRRRGPGGGPDRHAPGPRGPGHHPRRHLRRLGRGHQRRRFRRRPHRRPGSSGWPPSGARPPRPTSSPRAASRPPCASSSNARPSTATTASAGSSRPASPSSRIEEAPVHLEVVATSLIDGRTQWFTYGPAVEAILASAALPSLLPPVEIGTEVFIDGGVVDNVPIGRAIAQRGRTDLRLSLRPPPLHPPPLPPARRSHPHRLLHRHPRQVHPRARAPPPRGRGHRLLRRLRPRLPLRRLLGHRGPHRRRPGQRRHHPRFLAGRRPRLGHQPAPRLRSRRARDHLGRGRMTAPPSAPALGPADGRPRSPRPSEPHRALPRIDPLGHRRRPGGERRRPPLRHRLLAARRLQRCLPHRRPDVPADALVDRADAFFGARRRGYTVMVRDTEADEDLPAACRAAGLETFGEPAPEMICTAPGRRRPPRRRRHPHRHHRGRRGRLRRGHRRRLRHLRHAGGRRPPIS